MKILKGTIEYFVFALLAMPFILWLILKASATSFPVSSLIYLLAAAYGLYSVFVGAILRHSQRGATVLLGIYISAGVTLVPFAVLMSFILTGTKYTLYPAVYPFSFQSSKEPTSVGILLLYFFALEAVFATLWCPFRKYTACANSNCEMTKVCKGCKARGKSCERCNLLLVGFGCLFSSMVLFSLEASLIGRS